MCFFVNNQFRIIVQQTSSGSDNLEDVFESNLKRIGKMVAILDTWDQPVYLSRVWTVYEQYVASTIQVEAGASGNQQAFLVFIGLEYCLSQFRLFSSAAFPDFFQNRNTQSHDSAPTSSGAIHHAEGCRIALATAHRLGLRRHRRSDRIPQSGGFEASQSVGGGG